MEPGLFQKMKADKNLIHNLILMVMVWVASSFTFYLLNFMIKYMPGVPAGRRY